MDAKKLKKVVIDTVKRLADDYFDDMIRHPDSYDYFNAKDNDLCWEEAIEKAKDDMRQEPMKWIDEDDQEEIEEQDWFFIRGITDDISWLTYNNLEVQRCFQGVSV